METAISDIFISSRNWGDAFMKKENHMEGSMTVEASYVMLIILFLLIALIKHSFFLHNLVVGSASLHRAVEIERRLEDDVRKNHERSTRGMSEKNDGEKNDKGINSREMNGKEINSTEMNDKEINEENKEIDRKGKEYDTGFLFSKDVQISVKRGIFSCDGELKVGDVKKQISVKMFNPEEYMRAAAAFLPEWGKN